MHAEATKIAKETEDANIIAAQVAAELEKALPALQEAEAALNVLTKKDISELKVCCVVVGLLTLSPCRAIPSNRILMRSCQCDAAASRMFACHAATAMSHTAKAIDVSSS